MEHLGFILNSTDMTVSLTSKKKISLLAKCIEVINCKAPSIRAVAELIGILVSSFTGVEFGHLHYRQLELEKVLALKRVAGDYEKHFFLSERAKAEIQWWIVNVNSELRHIEHGKMLFTLTTDASTEVWGAVFESILDGDPQSTGGRWTLEEKKAHINKLELKAGMLGLQTFCSGIYKVHVKIYLDNTTAVAYINHMGGSHSEQCNTFAQDIWEFCRQRNLWITAAHLPGHFNVSRMFDDKTEWKLNTNVFQEIVSTFVVPEIDLFASRLNYQLKPYVAWAPDPEFTLDWSNFMFYAFPPFSILGQVLRKIEYDRAKGILVLPNWQTQAWFPLLRRLLITEPLTLNWHPDLVGLPFQQGQHPLGKKLQLMACFLSGVH